MAEMNPVDLFVPEIRACLRECQIPELRVLLEEINPIDLADGFAQFSPEEQIILFRLLPPNRRLIVFEELPPDFQAHVVAHLDDEKLRPLLESVPEQLASELMTSMPAHTVKRMTQFMRKDRLQRLKDAPTYPLQTAGALMTRDVPSLNADMTARQALDHLQANLRTREESNLYELYVANREGRLLGMVTLRTLIAAPRDVRLRDLMTPAGLTKIPAEMDQEEAAKVFARYRLMSAPVVDDQDRLVGVLMAGAMINVVQQESTEDIQKMGGLDTLDEPYFRVSFLRMVQKRGTWLCVLFVGELLTATAMSYFEHELARAVVLALFIPLIISSGGNSGSQAATLIVRAMALKEVTLRDWWRVMRREFAAGLALGSILGLMGFAQIVVRSQISHAYGPHYLGLGVVVGLTLILVVMWGTLCGSLLPLLLRRLGLDPAVVSTPFVATLVDVTGLVIYFSTALLVLRGSLL